MPKKRQIKKHSVKAQLQVMELAKARSSLHLEIYAAMNRRQSAVSRRQGAVHPVR